MKRGDVFTLSMRGPAGKPRPGIIVQANEFIRSDRPVLVCLLTSQVVDASFLRVDIDPSPDNGLRFPSQVMVDRMGAALPGSIGSIIGRLSAADLTRIDLAIVNVLGLGQAAALLAGGSRGR